jgi:DNA-binding CsgD family transcriptional regulator
MEVHPIRGDEHKKDNLGRQAIGLVDVVGRPAFSSVLFGLAREVLGCEHVTAFSLDGHCSPRVVLAENTGRERLAFAVAKKYTAYYWRLDPANRVFGRVGAGDDFWCVRISSRDIIDSAYRSHCYNAVGLDHRLSISHVRRGRTYRLNFYSGHGRTFSEAAAASVFNAADLLMALICRHDAESAVSPVLDRETFAQQLRAVAPELSARELEVAVLIASGLSSHGIALELGISINTVLTYRKRAYTRLDISTQNELMRLLLGTRSPI